VRPVTGRSHQIRLHLASLGHPILGDNLYAPPDVRALADRLCLHATELSVVHPTTQERCLWTVSCPF
jgi:tRNA pseudouridine32 synthase / 23S rRNA pseudouridine746 synthase